MNYKISINFLYLRNLFTIYIVKQPYSFLISPKSSKTYKATKLREFPAIFLAIKQSKGKRKQSRGKREAKRDKGKNLDLKRFVFHLLSLVKIGDKPEPPAMISDNSNSWPPSPPCLFRLMLVINVEVLQAQEPFHIRLPPPPTKQRVAVQWKVLSLQLFDSLFLSSRNRSEKADDLRLFFVEGGETENR